jgi:CBS domain-containing protein
MERGRQIRVLWDCGELVVEGGGRGILAKADDGIVKIMTTAVLSIGRSERAGAAWRLFRDYPLHHLPVVDGSQVVGMLSSADLMKIEHLLPRGVTDPQGWLDQRMRVADLVRRPVITIADTATIADAAASMARHGIHALPVVNTGGHLLGIVTTTDVMHGLLNADSSAEAAAFAAHLQPRMRDLEDLLRLVERYLAAGQDERLHAQLVIAVEKLRQVQGTL